MIWRQLEPGRYVEVINGAGPRLQIVWRNERWHVQRHAWTPSAAVFLAPVRIGSAATLAAAKALAESHDGHAC